MGTAAPRRTDDGDGRPRDRLANGTLLYTAAVFRAMSTSHPVLHFVVMWPVRDSVVANPAGSAWNVAAAQCCARADRERREVLPPAHRDRRRLHAAAPACGGERQVEREQDPRVVPSPGTGARGRRGGGRHRAPALPLLRPRRDMREVGGSLLRRGEHPDEPGASSAASSATEIRTVATWRRLRDTKGAVAASTGADRGAATCPALVGRRGFATATAAFLSGATATTAAATTIREALTRHPHRRCVEDDHAAGAAAAATATAIHAGRSTIASCPRSRDDSAGVNPDLLPREQERRTAAMASGAPAPAGVTVAPIAARAAAA